MKADIYGFPNTAPISTAPTPGAPLCSLARSYMKPLRSRGGSALFLLSFLFREEDARPSRRPAHVGAG